MKSIKINTMIVILIVIAVAVAYHQFVNFGVWFQIEDIHHELFISAALFGAALLYAVKKRKISL